MRIYLKKVGKKRKKNKNKISKTLFLISRIANTSDLIYNIKKKILFDLYKKTWKNYLKRFLSNSPDN
jgi:hypothetical protein